MVNISLNMLLSLVNDMIDLKLVKENRLEPQMKTFNPTKVIEFVISLLQVQAAGQNVTFSFKTVHYMLMRKIDSYKLFNRMPQVSLPETLEGDELRLS